VNTVYTNYIGQILLKKFQPAGGGSPAVEYFKYDSQGRQILRAEPAAVAGYNDACNDLGGETTILNAASGMVHLTDYPATPTATATTAGDAVGYPSGRRIRQGRSAASLKISAAKYFARGSGSSAIFVPAEQTAFRVGDANDSGVTTTYSYLWHDSSFQIQQRTSTLPAVPETQNGPNTTATRIERFDIDGQLIWEQDPRGTVTIHE